MKKMMKQKKILSCLLSLVLTLGLCGIRSEAASASLSVMTGTGAPGQEVSLNITLNDNPGIMAMIIPLTYDSGRLTFISGSGAAAMGGNWQNDPAGIPYLWDNSADSTYNGTVITLNFRINADAPEGFASVSIGNGAYGGNFNEEKVTFSLTQGGITVTTASSEPPSSSPETSSQETSVAPTASSEKETTGKESGKEPSGSREEESTEVSESESSREEPTVESTEKSSKEETSTEPAVETTTERTTETENVKATVRSGEEAELQLGKGKARICLPLPKAEGAELELECSGRFVEGLLTAEEKKQVEAGAEVKFEISADWVAEEEMSYKNHEALKKELEELQKNGTPAQILGALKLEVIKQIGDKAAERLTEENVAEALAAGDGRLRLNLSRPEETEGERYVVLLQKNGNTKFQKISGEEELVTMEAGCVPIAIVRVAGAAPEQKKKPVLYLAGAGLVLFLLVLVWYFRKKRKKAE